MPDHLNRQQLAWKKAGRCWQCGGKIDMPTRYVKCAACRDAQTQKARAKKRMKMMAKSPEEIETERILKEIEKQRRKKEREEAKKEAEKKRMQEICKRCEWTSFTGEGFLCPFPEGACIKQVKY